MNGNTIRKVTSFMALNVDGIDKIVYTYSEIDAETGKEITGNQKKNFYVVSKEVSDAINLVKNYILQNQLGD